MNESKWWGLVLAIWLLIKRVGEFLSDIGWKWIAGIVIVLILAVGGGIFVASSNGGLPGLAYRFTRYLPQQSKPLNRADYIARMADIRAVYLVEVKRAAPALNKLPSSSDEAAAFAAWLKDLARAIDAVPHAPDADAERSTAIVASHNFIVCSDLIYLSMTHTNSDSSGSADGIGEVVSGGAIHSCHYAATALAWAATKPDPPGAT